jgi:alkaline phosphatase D
LFLTLLSANKNDQYVLLISFDGFRADYIDWYDTPNFDQIKLNGVKAKSLKPVFPTKTFPNHYSIATGMYVENHGLIGNQFFDKKLNEFYQTKDREKVEDKRFYGGEPIWSTAEKQGLKTASYFWVGSEAQAGGHYPSIWKKYDQKQSFDARIDSVIKWFEKPIKNRPRLVLLYFHEPDNTGQKYGPRSKENKLMVESVDRTIGNILNKLKTLTIYKKLNVILVSDHGMTEIDKTKKIVLSKYIDTKKIKMEGSGAYTLLYSDENNEIEKSYLKLKQLSNIDVYKKENIPDKWRFKRHHRIKDILIVAKEGWTILKDNLEGSYYFYSKAAHGYDNDLQSMQAIFFAQGPAFKKDYTISSINNIDIYPLIAHILNIKSYHEIDGKLENVINLLDE